ncbi:amphi-Trp domain-containing protein [Streptomyces sp. NPDC058084]|uniref:amphi-Trp domain-containing protein n=1 Tax=Streptomyces sp. NPDC058084 TaxID=3346333 RepID=UPI0036E7C7C8
MKDLKFEQKRSLTRDEAADLLAELAKAFREGGEAELELGTGVLSLRVPEKFRTEVEFEVGGGEIELEIELKWRTDGGRGASAEAAPGRKAGEPRAAAEPEAAATSGAAESDEETGGSDAPAAPSDTRSRKSTSSAQKRSPAKRSTAKRTPAKRTSAKRSSAKQP